MKRAKLFIPLLILLFICDCSYSLNSVKHFSFELTLDNWEVWSFREGTVERTNEKAKHGEYSLAIRTKSLENDVCAYKELVVKPNTYYKLTGWISTDNLKEDRIGATIGIYDSFFTTKDITGTKDWTFMKMTFKTGSKQKKVILCARIGQTGSITTGTAFFDDIKLIELDNKPSGSFFSLQQVDTVSTQIAPITKSGNVDNNGGLVLFLIIFFTILLSLSGVIILNRNIRKIISNSISSIFINTISYLKNNRGLIIKIVIFACLYFFIRSNWQNTFEFEYDQTRISNIMIQVIEKGDYLNVTDFIFCSVTEEVMTFGPFMIYFLLPFYLLTSDPIIITHIIIIINFLGIIFTYLSAKLLFNKRVAIFSTLFIIAYPWSVIFSRMIYNPTPLLCFIPIVCYVTLVIIKKNKPKLFIILPMLWGMMAQFHYISVPVAILSFLYIAIHFKKIKWYYFIIGIVIGILPWISLIKYELDNQFKFITGILSARDFLEKGTNLWEMIVLTTQKTFTFLSLIEMDAHISYGKDIVNSMLPFPYFIFFWTYIVLFITSFIYYVFRLFLKRKLDDFFIFLWFISVSVFIIAFNLKNTISPRYFLIVILPLAFMIGHTIDKGIIFIINRKVIKNLIKAKDKVLKITSLTISMVFLISFFIYMITYNHFITLSDYSQVSFYGWLHPDSAPPYSFSHDSLQYALDLAHKQGYYKCVFSSDFKVKNKYHETITQRYIWEEVFKLDLKYSPSLPFYYIVKEPPREGERFKLLKRFGCFRVYSEMP